MSESVHAAHYALRDKLLDALRADLLGPTNGEDELLTDDAPITVYPVGVLFPRPSDSAAAEVTSEVDSEADGLDEPALTRRRAEEDDPGDLGVSLANRRRPSSMGLTFAVDPTAGRTLLIHVETARYVPEDSAGLPVAARRAEDRSTEKQLEQWRRNPLQLDPVGIDIAVGGPSRTVSLCEGLELRVLVREPAGPYGTVTVTVTLVNTLEVGQFDLQDAHCFFQPTLRVTGATAVAAPFVERPALLGAVDAELRLSRLLHRHAPSFAIGHGCAAHWDWTPPVLGDVAGARSAVREVRTEFVPSHEVLLTDSNPAIKDAALTMYGLATATHGAIQDALQGVLSGYETWIAERAAEAALLAGTDHEQAAVEQVELCREALRRMRRGVALLGDNDQPHILTAFRLANHAMAQQRARTSWIKNGRPGTPDLGAGKWRPFQISFLLLCLEGIVDPEHGDRSLADLLWFPTGGGKTEAYLGLIAFTTFHRRLRHGAAGGGVTVLMRYTLRLLTLQQFERAAALICAMEDLRRADPPALGTEEISIGMWVGASATPNLLATAADKLSELSANPAKPLLKDNPVQLHKCPWCGSALYAGDYSVDTVRKRMTVRCPDAACAFHTSGLPVHLVDESVYDARPTLIIATVDKFASMPWRPEAAAVFNRDRPGTLPPELIVQDELHLISGPLGTLTGLYEAAVDRLCSLEPSGAGEAKPIGPKVIASTATIRRAGDQGRALFNREVAQFPPGGLDSRDSWFAVETARDRKAARQYIGLLTPSTSQATLLVRVYAALLHGATATDSTPEVRDAYWTLVGYFNSLRLLAAAELQVLDDVQDRLEYLATRDGLDVRKVDSPTELSSRADAGEIPRRLAQLERRLPGSDVVDVLLATNMISVGVDIDRLGLMAVMGQPQTTAEYIQATSRVGRQHPGLVAVLLNSARSRDRSHYESFLHYHSALYREVESTSVTPFSARARDRGLHAVVVALARVLIPRARDNEAAGHIHDFVDELWEKVMPVVVERVSRIDREEEDATVQALERFVRRWMQDADEYPGLVYRSGRNSRSAALLGNFDDPGDAYGTPTLWSLRDVDAESTLFLEA